MEHTKEPWPVFTDVAVMMTPNPEGDPVAVLSWDDYIRARACVNACAGIPTENLERWGNTVGTGQRRVMELEQQRDELLAALEIIAKDATSTYEDAWCGDIAREAIAKATAQPAQPTPATPDTEGR